MTDTTAQKIEQLRTTVLGLEGEWKERRYPSVRIPLPGSGGRYLAFYTETGFWLGRLTVHTMLESELIETVEALPALRDRIRTVKSDLDARLPKLIEMVKGLAEEVE